MGQPLVSVIMGVFKCDEEELVQAIDSILNQTYRNLEFIIWYDGSNKETIGLLHRISSKDLRIRIAGTKENHGLAHSLNECIRLAKGSYIARMDADDISKPERIESQVRFLEQNKNYDWCGTSVELFDERGVWGTRIMPEVPQMINYFHYSPFVHPSVMFRAKLFENNLGYLTIDETERCEDYEIFMHLVSKGKEGYNLQDKLFYYRETRDSYKKRRNKFRFREAKIRYRSYKKLGVLWPFGWIYVFRPILAIVMPTRAIALIKRNEGVKVKAKEEKREVGHLEKSRVSDETVLVQK